MASVFRFLCETKCSRRNIFIYIYMYTYKDYLFEGIFHFFNVNLGVYINHTQTDRSWS